jgi:hypothetical protein
VLSVGSKVSLSNLVHSLNQLELEKIAICFAVSSLKKKLGKFSFPPAVGSSVFFPRQSPWVSCTWYQVQLQDIAAFSDMSTRVRLKSCKNLNDMNPLLSSVQIRRRKKDIAHSDR